jgi:hypothetical protein
LATDDQVLKATVSKVDTTLGLVFGWGIICTEKSADGQWVDHYDTQKDHIPEPVMLDAVSDFMENARSAHDMHKGSQHGTIVHSFPLTRDIAEKMGIESGKTGWMVAMKPGPEQLAKFASGEYTGFSIGGGCEFIPEAE